MKRIVGFFREQSLPFRNLLILEGIFFLLSLLSLVQPEVLRQATDALSSGDGEKLKRTLILAVVMAVLGIGVSFLRDIYRIRTGNRYQQILSERMMERLLAAKMEVLQGKQFGDVATAFTRNVERYVNTALEAILLLSRGAFALVLTFLYMCVIEWRLAVCVLVYNLVIRFFAIFVERKIRRNEQALTASLQESGNLLSSLLQNMLMVRVYSNRDFFRSRWERTERKVMRAGWKNFVWQNGFQDFIWAFSKLAEFVIVYGVGAWLILMGESDISILLSFVFVNDLFTIGINDLSYAMVNRAQAEVSQTSLEEMLSLESADDGAEVDAEVAAASEKHENGCAGVGVQFDQVSFSYGERRLLEDVSFYIQPGEKVLLQGPNGQGKSTLLKLIAGLYHPQEGKIHVGDCCTAEVSQRQLTQQYGYISQHSNMLSGSVMENLAVSRQVDEKRAEGILERLKLSGVLRHDPKSLSMGEQQRLNIGRAFYQPTKGLLLCDEIFSNVDGENRQLILQELRERYAEATVIMITHEEVDFAFDRVLEVSGGQVMSRQVTERGGC